MTHGWRVVTESEASGSHILAAGTVRQHHLNGATGGSGADERTAVGGGDIQLPGRRRKQQEVIRDADPAGAGPDRKRTGKDRRDHLLRPTGIPGSVGTGELDCVSG